MGNAEQNYQGKVMRFLRFVFVDLVEYVLVGIMVVLCADIFYGVFTRYVMAEAAPWYDEVARYLFIWMTLLGAAVAVRRRAHFVVRLLIDRLGRKVQSGIGLLCYIIIIAFSVFIMIQGLKVVEGVSVQTSPALGLTLSWIFCKQFQFMEYFA